MSTITDLQTLINTNLESASNITAVELRAVFNSFLTTTAHLYEVKQLDVPTSFIADNFDGTGLGIDAYVGWAICNGNNGTLNRGGRVAIGYDETNYSTLGAVGGSKDAVVVSHSHYTTVYGSETDGSGSSLYDGVDVNRKEQGLCSRGFNQSTDVFDYELTTSIGDIASGKTSTSGVSGTNANMQPYLVTLFIQRIA